MSLLGSLSIFIFCTLAIGMGIHLVCKIVDLLALPLKVVIGSKNRNQNA